MGEEEYLLFISKNIHTIHIAPPSITNPFSIRGSTTRINGGANGKFSGNIRCNKICSIFSSFISSAKGESGSTECNRAYHSYKLSLTSSTFKEKIL